MNLRTNPATVRLALAHAERHGIAATIRTFNVSARNLYRWKDARATHGPDWPTLDMDREWIEKRAARKANAAALASYRKRRYLNRGPLLVDATGTIRRIRALHALGWPAHEIARRGPWTTGEAVLEIAGRARVQRTTAETVAAIYDDLCMTPGPSPWTRAHARRNGWAVPLAWDDIDNDEAPHVGRETTRPAAVLLAEWAHLTGLGVSEHHAAQQLGVSVKAIEKARERAGAVA